MTKRKSTKRALLLSALSLLMCVSMLIGTTFAWFTDSVTSAGNIIQSGTLDVDLVDEQNNSMAGKVIKFDALDDRAQNEILWEPGCTYNTEPVYVVNKGNLALKYRITINGIEGNAKLLEVIEWTVTINGVETDLANFEGQLIPGQTAKSPAIVLTGHMKEEAGNEYQGLTVEGISITVTATQLTSEFDSFNDQYDKDASMPICSAPAVIDKTPIAPVILETPNATVTVPTEVAADIFDDSVKFLVLKHSEPEISTGTVNFGFLELVDQDDNVVDLEAMGNQTPITVKLPTTEVDGTLVEICHDNEFITSATAAGGFITYTAKHFCQVSVKAIGSQGVYGGIDWVLYKDGTLKISPTKGEPVPDKEAPTKRTYEVGEWPENVIYKSNGSASAIGGQPYDAKAVKSLIIEEGVTTIGSFTVQFPNLTGEVVIPSTVTYIGQEAFHKTPITKLTFAEGGTEKLCIANGAFKKLQITEVSLPGDRPDIHVHHWAFGGCLKLQHAYIPANITKMWGGEHVDYFDNFNAQTNVTWGNYGSMFTGCTAMQTITFESEEARDNFVAGRQNSNEDYIVAYVGLTGYNSIKAAIDAAETGDTIGLIRNTDEAATIPAGVAFNDNGYKADKVTFG